MDRNVNYERFPSEYFSGCDIRIYFDDTMIDEVTKLSFQLQEMVMPIFGYNSYTMDDSFRGARVVQGSFAINFKDVNYLYSAVKNVIGDEDINDSYSTDLDPNEDVEDMLYDYKRQGWSKKFKQKSQKLEEKIWGSARSDQEAENNETFFPKESFDIIITYGPYKQAGSRPDVEQKYYDNVNKGTVKAINNVHLTNVKQATDLSGKPVQEVYTFIAEDLDRR